MKAIRISLLGFLVTALVLVAWSLPHLDPATLTGLIPIEFAFDVLATIYLVFILSSTKALRLWVVTMLAIATVLITAGLAPIVYSSFVPLDANVRSSLRALAVLLIGSVPIFKMVVIFLVRRGIED